VDSRRRLSAYADHLAATDNYLRAAQHDEDNSEFSAVSTDSIRSLSVLQLIGPDGVAESAAAFQNATREVAARVNLFPRDPAWKELDEDRLTKRRAFIAAAAAARKQVKIKR
jgi:hypothetical protein